ncbi:AraC family transcriptional regulator [Microbulbifer pacificus]|uniref:AraC family transcriptional regulator n=1 Tax=Microbulbifer pacificus TaxID=407164 RepID=A0AAU0MWL6_9GAMM|nr:AraC family transcriptional regulator [Microbulbifer pacificus]WOX04426.1 AraC family transcriptional regulator [Microbulbifer pacificus]
METESITTEHQASTEQQASTAGFEARGILAAAVYAHLAGARAAGVDCDQLLLDAGIAPASAQVPDARIGREQLARLLRLLWDQLGDESGGYLARPWLPGTFAMMGHATLSSPTLRRALLRSSRFVAMVSDDLHIKLVEDGEEAKLIIHHGNQKRLQNQNFVESLAVIWLRFFSWLIDRTILLERVHLAFPPPDYDEEYNDMFPCRHYFHQRETCLVFSTRYLSMPLVRDAQQLSEFLARAPECLLAQYKSDNSFTGRIRRMLQSHNSIENLSLDDVAERLFTSPQTLRRRLKDEGNSWQDIKDSVRRDMAMYQLKQQETAVAEIAERLGFSEPSAFNRAFKKWTGLAPGAYREKHRG